MGLAKKRFDLRFGGERKTTMRTKHYEKDDAAFPADAYAVQGNKGIAYYVLGWETEPTEDTEWDGIEERTGRVVGVMVGDDHRWTFDPEDLTPIVSGEDYCPGCGQIGCGWGH